MSQTLFDRIASGFRGRGHREAVVGMPAMQLANERCDGHDLAEGYRVHPDQRPVIGADAWTAQPQPFG